MNEILEGLFVTAKYLSTSWLLHPSIVLLFKKKRIPTLSNYSQSKIVYWTKLATKCEGWIKPFLDMHKNCLENSPPMCSFLRSHWKIYFIKQMKQIIKKGRTQGTQGNVKCDTKRSRGNNQHNNKEKCQDDICIPIT